MVVLCGSFFSSQSFNLDTADFVRYSGERDSMFGFSVAAHRDRDYNWVIIGAPQAQSTQPGVVRGGAVYYCPADRDDGCRELGFDRSGNYNSSSGHQIDEKSGQWFGATVSSGGPNRPIVACAPRYLWYTLKNGRRDPVGTCYVSSSDFREFSEFSPCRTRHWGYHRQGTCQAGLGAAVSKDGERLFIGAPGSWYWQGQMYSIDPDAKLPYTPPRYSNYGTSAGQLYSQHLKKRPAVFFTKEGQPKDDDSYMGYSVTSGNFTGDREGGIAAGMPRGKELVGKVVLYTWNLTNHQNVSGTQLGAYFGYAVAAADMNGDGLDDLIVGAPLHTEPNNEGKYEMGRIYVIYPVRPQNDPDAALNARWARLRNVDKIDGTNSKARFGLSVASLGDLDLDGYQDIAVGAPYDGPLERGAVYIFYGSKKGIRSKASQVIHSEEVTQTAMYTFGFSVSGSGIDLDNNQYPDLVVGSYLSNAAFVFRSRPVINVEASVLFNTHNKVIGLDERNCTIGRDKYVSCTTLNACVKYNGVGVGNGINMVMEFILDAKKSKDPRMFLYPSDRRNKFNETWTLRRDDMQCKSMQVYIRENTRDKLTPLEVEMRYSLFNELTHKPLEHYRNPRSELKPVLNGNLPSKFKDSIVIRKNCGSDDVCIPDLRLFVKPNVNRYLLGSGKRLEIDVIVKNEGEDSFESMFYMKMPPGINFFNTERLSGSLEIPIKCSPPSETTNNTMKCDIGNPLPKDKLVHFKVMLDPFNMEGMNPSYDFSMKINSTNPENGTVADNIKNLSIDIWVKTNLSLTGWAQSPDIHYKENQYKQETENYTVESDIGPQIVHIYSIKNNGPSDIKEAEVVFMWPSETLGGSDLLYLMEQPELSGPIKCEFIQDANPLKVELLPRKYYLEQDGKKGSSKVTSEERLTSNVGSSISGRHEHKEESEDKLDETGDASHVHVNRGKERTQGGASSNSNVNIGTHAGSTTVTRTENTYSWNSSTVNGGPVRTWSKNTSSVTGQDGVTQFKESSSSGSGAHGSDDNINKYKIYYTSTGDQQENRFGAGSSAQEVSISDNSNIGHYNISDSSQQGYNNYGQTGSDQYGASHQSVDHTRQPGSVHSYFDWDSSAPGGDISRTSTSSTFGTTHHQTGTGGSTITGGNSGYISGSGEIVYHQPGTVSHGSGSRTEDSFGTRFSGTRGGTINYGTDGSRNEENHGTINYGSGGIQTSGSRHEESHGTVTHGATGPRVSGGRHEESHGTVTYGADGSRTSGDRHDESHGTVNYGSDNTRTSGSRHEESHGTVNYGSDNTRTSGGRHEDGHGIINYGTDHSRTSGTRHDESHGIINYGTDHTRTGSDRSESSHGVVNYGTGESRDRTRTDENVFREFYTLSGKDLRGLISEEDLRNMLQSGNGEYKNETHTIRWTIDNQGFKVQNDTFGYRRPYSISTEESVNQGLDEYTRTVTQRGSHASQTNRQSGGRDRSSYGQYDQTHGHSSGGIGDAALGGGFRTTALDLGSLSNTNSGHASTTGQLEPSRINSQHYGTSSYYDPDLDSYEDRSAEANKQGSVTYGSSRTYSSGAHSSPGSGARHDSSADGGHGGQFETHSSSYSYSSGNTGTRNFVGDNVPTEFPTDTDYRNRIYRNKREADDEINNIIQCKSTKCSAIRCLAGPLTKHEEAWAALRFRANAATLKEIGWTQVITVSSMMVSRINKLPYIGTPNDRPIHTHEVFTNMTLTETEIKPDVVPLWVVVLSACAGAIILLLLILLLYKCGFFKRNRPSDAPERQPLNRNGHYQGDEQL